VTQGTLIMLYSPNIDGVRAFVTYKQTLLLFFCKRLATFIISWRDFQVLKKNQCPAEIHAINSAFFPTSAAV